MNATPQYGWNRAGYVMPPGGIGSLGDSRPITQAIGSGLLSAAGPIALIPFGQLPAAIIAAVGALTNLIGGFFKPDLTKIQASQIVDRIEAETLKPLRDDWKSLPADKKTTALQAAYLEVFDAAWKSVLQGCRNPALAQAGVNCIADRQQGGCHYTVDGQTPGVPPNCGNWFIWYRSPIADDPDVTASAAQNPTTQQPTDTSTPGSAGGSNDTSTGNTSTISSSSTFLYGGLALLGIALVFSFMGGD